jgi:general secretion pathway protein D
MRALWPLVVAVMVCRMALADDTPPAAPQTLITGPCEPVTAACNPSKSDRKKAKAAFSKALKLEKSKHLDEAYKDFDTAARLVPNNLSYVTALAMTREELVHNHVQQGSADLNNGQEVEAQAEFRGALSLDPDNQFAQQRMQESLGSWAPSKTPMLRATEDGGELHAEPSPGHHAFHFRGDSKALLTQVAQAYGVTADLDDSVVSRRVHFDIEEADFNTAMRAACAVTGTFWTSLSDHQILLAKESPDNHRLYDRMGLRTFYMNWSTSPLDMNEVVSMLRTVFEIRFLQQRAQSNTLTVRAPMPVLNAITQLIENFGNARPQVILDLEVYEIDHQLTRNIGLHIPDTFNLFNIPAAALLAASGQNIQSLINQLISGGGINQANSSAISGLLAQLQGQGQSGIFSQPLATFGGGLTFMGLSLDTLAAQLSLNESWVKHLDHATMRAAQGNDMTFRLGQRYPVINASFAPVFNSSAISQVLQNGSFQAPIPSFTYEDLGLDVKAKPTVSGGVHVGLDLEIKLRALAGTSVNGVPIIANREYKGSINLEDGEPAVVASSVTRSEQYTMMGIPGLNSVPVLNKIATTNNKTAEDDEILLVITPHVMNLGDKQSTELWLPR